MFAKSVFGSLVFGCERLFNALLEGRLGYGKSPCFLEVCFLWVFGPGLLVYTLMVVDGVKTLD